MTQLVAFISYFFFLDDLIEYIVDGFLLVFSIILTFLQLKAVFLKYLLLFLLLFFKKVKSEKSTPLYICFFFLILLEVYNLVRTASILMGNKFSGKSLEIQFDSEIIALLAGFLKELFFNILLKKFQSQF